MKKTAFSIVRILAVSWLLSIVPGCNKTGCDYVPVQNPKVITIEATDDLAWEIDRDSASFIVNSGGPNTTGEDLIVYLDISGSAKMGVDCDSVVPEGKVIIPPNQQYASVIVKGVKCNGVIEETKSVILTISGCSNDDYSIGAENQSGIAIMDGDGGTVFDIDGNEYHTVKIGSQTWLVENLKTSRFRNGDAVERNGKALHWFPNNSPVLGNSYGWIYSWFAANDPRGLAPVGWHIPSDEEWKYLIGYLTYKGDGAGKKLKTTSDWYKKRGGTNESGFTGWPAGDRFAKTGTFNGVSKYANFWSSSKSEPTMTGSFFYLTYENSTVYHSYSDMDDGCSVRCIKD